MDRIVVITGGTSGIGLKTAEYYKNNHDKVIVISRSAKSEDGMSYSCDISNEENVKNVFNDIITRFGRIDVLINNAGFGMSGITELISSEETKRIFDVNFFGTVYCCKHALPFMQKGSKIINIGSAMSLFPVPFRTFYAASKNAINSFTLCLKAECKLIDVDVCAILPGDVKTNFTTNRVKEFETNERYGNVMQKSTKMLDSREDKRMSAEVVAKKIFKVSNKKKTKPYYIVGAKYKALNFIFRLLPINTQLKLITKFTMVKGDK